MDEADDLSNAHPAHWPEARRRIGVLKQYVALEKPTTQDLARHADELSMSTEQFRRLLKAWNLFGDAGKLPGIRQARPLKRSTHNRIPTATASIMSNVIRDMIETGSAAEIFEEIKSRCATAERSLPSLGTVCAAIMDERSKRLTTAADTKSTKLLVASCWAALPFDHNGRVVTPRLSLAILIPSGYIVACRWSPDANQVVEILADVVDKSFDAATSIIPLEVHLPDDPVGRKVEERLARAGADTGDLSFGTVGSSEIAAVVGKRIGDLRLILRFREARPKSLLRDRLDTPVSLDDMSSVVQHSVERHNALCRLSEQPFRICSTGADAELSRWLRSIS